MTTLTLQLDPQTANRARRVAQTRRTTLESLVAEYVQQLAGTEEQARTDAAEHLLRTLRELSRPMGGKPWKSRDELYER